MARSAFIYPMTGQQVQAVSSGGGWKSLLYFMLAAAGVGFAGYLFLVPYQQVKGALSARSTELGAERSAAQELTGERDKLKAEVTRLSAAADDKAANDGKRKAA